MLALVEAIDEFNDELRHLYGYVERNNSSANIFAHHKDTSDVTVFISEAIRARRAERFRQVQQVYSGFGGVS